MQLDESMWNRPRNNFFFSLMYTRKKIKKKIKAKIYGGIDERKCHFRLNGCPSNRKSNDADFFLFRFFLVEIYHLFIFFPLSLFQQNAKITRRNLDEVLHHCYLTANLCCASTQHRGLFHANARVFSRLLLTPRFYFELGVYYMQLATLQLCSLSDLSRYCRDRFGRFPDELFCNFRFSLSALHTYIYICMYVCNVIAKRDCRLQPRMSDKEF